jgi:hypothetical protein
MVAQQRYAVFNLVIAGFALVLFLVLIPIIGMWRAQAAFAFLAFSALGPYFFRKRKGQIAGDERDQVIHLRAIQIGFGAFWLLFVGGIMSTYVYLQHQATMSVEILPLMVWLGWIAFVLCQAVALLVLYRRF